MSKLAQPSTKKPMTRRKFLLNQIALLIVVSLFLVDKSMFTSWIRNFFNMLNITNAEPIIMALMTPIRAVHILAPAISQLCLLQMVFAFSYIRLVFVLFFSIKELNNVIVVEKLSLPKMNDNLENCQLTYKETQRFLC